MTPIGRSQEANKDALTFLYHSLQDVHVVLLRHSAEGWELRLGNELQELEQRERERKKN